MARPNVCRRYLPFLHLQPETLLVDPLTLCDVPLPMLREILPHLSQAFFVKLALLPLLKNRVENVGQIPNRCREEFPT
jgi:hypothetical protein